MLKWPVGSDFKSNLCDVHNLEHSTVYSLHNRREPSLLLWSREIYCALLDMIDIYKYVSISFQYYTSIKIKNSCQYNYLMADSLEMSHSGTAWS